MALTANDKPFVKEMLIAEAGIREVSETELCKQYWIGYIARGNSEYDFISTIYDTLSVREGARTDMDPFWTFDSIVEDLFEGHEDDAKEDIDVTLRTINDEISWYLSAHDSLRGRSNSVMEG